MTSSVLDPARYPPIPPALLSRSRVIPNRGAALPFWPKDAVIVEVGVGLGGFSESILKVCRPRRFLAIDRFDLHELPALWGVPTAQHFGARTHEAFYRHRFAAEIAEGRVEVIRGDSGQTIAGLADDSVDVFYVDADHTYDGARRDLEALAPKIRPDGWIVMNDYVPLGVGLDDYPYGVIQATNEFMAAYHWEMIYFALAPAMYCDVGLRKLGAAAAPVRLDTSMPLPVAVSPLQPRIEALERELQAMRRSRSWRLTAPLRAIVRRSTRR